MKEKEARQGDARLSIRKLKALYPNDKVYYSGSNLPMDIVCVDPQNGREERIVIKFNGAERMTPVAVSFEILGNLLGKMWGLWLPEPVLVEVDEEFVELMRGNPLYKIASESKGLNFGSIREDGLLDPDPELLSSTVKIETLQTIFAFDTFIDNLDRSKEKPNLKVRDGKVFIFDHELAFSFCRSLFGCKNLPWQKSKEELAILLNRSYLYEQIRGRPIPETRWIQILKLIQDIGIEFLINFVPVEFRNDNLNLILRNLNITLQEKYTYITWLKTILQ